MLSQHGGSRQQRAHTQASNKDLRRIGSSWEFAHLLIDDGVYHANRLSQGSLIDGTVHIDLLASVITILGCFCKLIGIDYRVFPS